MKIKLELDKLPLDFIRDLYKLLQEYTGDQYPYPIQYEKTVLSLLNEIKKYAVSIGDTEPCWNLSHLDLRDVNDIEKIIIQNSGAVFYDGQFLGLAEQFNPFYQGV